MLPIKTYNQERIKIDITKDTCDRIENHYGSLAKFIDKLQSFNVTLEKNRDEYNINPYSDKLGQGIYILAKDSSELEIFPHASLAFKCSQGKFLAENLKKQFDRSIQLSIEFETKLNAKERAMLQICPVYLHFETSAIDVFFKQILFMQNIEGGVTLGETKTGFSLEFCQVFKIPSLEEILVKPQFNLHLLLDKDRQRQLLKIQTVYLFRRLLSKGIRIFSLNQKNILLSQDKYIIIDPTIDFLKPISPLYNILTYQLCTHIA
ncbi:hypothetical protein NIES593_10230 [Hydrococcus rivularis NIES-593]|uniref:Uncharacterized protein n=1 Tax=Hydrococcus rivularis NIES-593 TaxID=1921803 RepID=A0A1U7HI31_9CYAN|nr:hypothetical protein [Hydrococcus rivularis]OKH23214.1 hypothetical protein NIES593_10230 [Hydrococcus rivularis NIES-593]